MSENAVSIRVTQKREKSKVLGVPVPFSSYFVSNGNYSFSNGTGQGCEGAFGPLECLTDLLVNVELNRNGKPIGPIHATFELIGDGRSCGLHMEKMLEMYARSEQTTVTFDYKE